jgi:hypothetical protein
MKYLNLLMNQKAETLYLMSRTIYRLRWNIEIIFKIWKSYMNFGNVHNVSERQFKTLMAARQIMIIICTNINALCCLHIRKYYDRELSMMKFIGCLMKNPGQIIEILSCPLGLAFNQPDSHLKTTNHSTLFKKKAALSDSFSF